MHVCEGEWTVTSPADVVKVVPPSADFPVISDSIVPRDRFAQAFAAAVSRSAGVDGVVRMVTRAFVGIGHLAHAVDARRLLD